MNFFIAKHRILLSKITTVILLILIFVCKPHFYSIYTYLFLKIIGVTLIFIGIMGRVLSSIYMGSNRNRDIVVMGPYSITRNPLYLSSFIATLGIMMVYGSIILAIIISIIYLSYYKGVIIFEEKSLSEGFGDKYISYLNSGVPRFFPKFSLWKEEDMFKVDSSVIIKTILDAYWFVFTGLILTILSHLHYEGVLPYLISLY